MNVNNKTIKLLVFITLLLIPIEMCMAYSVKTKLDVQVWAGDSFAYKKTVDGVDVICTQSEKDSPTSCSKTITLSSKVAAGVGSIIKYYNNGGNYICTQKLITKFMYNKYITTGRANYDIWTAKWAVACGSTKMNDIYTNAVNVYDEVQDISSSTIRYTETSLKFTASGDDYISRVNVSYDTGYSLDCSVNIGTVSLSGNTATIKVNKSNSGKKITLTCRPSYTYDSPKNYYASCNDQYGQDAQEVVSSNLEKKTVYGTEAKISGSFSNDEPTGRLIIKKYDSNGNKIITEPKQDPNVKFNIYKEENGKYKLISTTPTMINLSIKDSIELDLGVGKYKIEEYAAPYGYKSSGEVVSGNQTIYGNSIEVEITKGADVTVTFYNQKETTTQTCEELANASKGNINERVKLYQKYKAEGKNYTNLLDINSEGATACSEKTTCDQSLNIRTGCFSGQMSLGTNFNENDLSCYNDSYISNNIIGFCQTTFGITNLLGKNSFTSKAGQLLIKGTNSNVSTAASVTLNKICYMYSLNGENYNYYTTKLQLSDFSGTDTKYIAKLGTVQNVYFDYSLTDVNGVLNTENLSLVNTFYKVEDYTNTYKTFYPNNPTSRISRMVLEKDTNNKYTGSLTFYINLMPTVVKKVSGEIEPVTTTNIYEQIDSNNMKYGGLGVSSICPSCVFLGYGITSKLDAKPINGLLKLNYKFTTSEKEYDETSTCAYSIGSDDPFEEDEDIDLEFRTISKSNPFPGKSGSTSRKVGSNWCDLEDCSSDNKVIEKVIKNSNDSYNSTGTGAIYKIELSSSTIQEIREYNKNRNYDEYDLECDSNGSNCTSNFLEQFSITRLQ